MPHYKTGERAEHGDIVQGVGANIPNVTGVIVDIEHSHHSCQLRIAHGFGFFPKSEDVYLCDPPPRKPIHDAAMHGMLRNIIIYDGSIHVPLNLLDGMSVLNTYGIWMTFSVEYGDADKFRLIARGQTRYDESA